MAIEVTQGWQGYQIRIGDRQSISSDYTITGTELEGDAWAALDAYVATFLSGFATMLGKAEVNINERLAFDAWSGSVTWNQPEVGENNESQFTFETGGGSSKITQSFGTTPYAPAGQTAPAVKGIGDNGKTVEGVDVTIPMLNFSETHQVPAASVTAAYIKTVARLTGKVNAGVFRDFAAREVLFLGASGSRKGIDNWEIGYKFAASENATGLVVGSITGIAKGGHDYIWVRYQESEDTTAFSVVMDPVAAYVERVYQSADFGLLLI